MSLILLLFGLFFIFKGNFRLLGRNVPKDQGRLIGVLLSAPFTIYMCATMFVVSAYMSAPDFNPMTADSMEMVTEIMDSQNGSMLVTLDLVSMLVCGGLALYLVLSRPQSPPNVMPNFPNMTTPPSQAYPAAFSSASRASAPPPTIMTVPEAAAYLRVTEADIEDLITQGKLPAARTASGYRIARSVIDEYLKNG